MGPPWAERRNDQLGQLENQQVIFTIPKKEIIIRLEGVFGTKGDIYLSFFRGVFAFKIYMFHAFCSSFIHFHPFSSIFIHFQQVCPNASSRYRDVWCARVDDLAKAEPDGFCAGARPRTAEPCPDSMERWENPGCKKVVLLGVIYYP